MRLRWGRRERRERRATYTGGSHLFVGEQGLVVDWGRGTVDGRLMGRDEPLV